MSESAYEPLAPDDPPPPPPPQTSLLPAVFLGFLALVGSGAAAWYWMKPGPPAAPSNAGPPPADPVARGRLVYQAACAACHGPDGHGDGPSAAPLPVKPRDFASTRWRLGTDPAVIRRAIEKGVLPDMPAFPNLSPADLDAVTAYVKSLAPPTDETTADFRRMTALLAKANFAPAPAPSVPPTLAATDAQERPVRPVVRGKLVLVVFWGTTCVPCLKEFPALEKLAADYRDRGLVVVPACTDADAIDAEAAARPHAKTLPVFAVPEAAKAAYGVQVLPTAVLVDADGRELGRHAGAFDWSAPAARAMIDGCLPGK